MKRIISIVFAAVFAFCTAFLIGCDFLGSKDDVDDGDSGGSAISGVPVTPVYIERSQETYTILGDKIILSEQAGRIRCGQYCMDDSLVVYCDTSQTDESIDTIAFVLSADTLRMQTDMTTTTDGDVIQWWIVMARKGSGSGIQGMWTLVTHEYTVVSGSVDAAEKAQLDGYIEPMNKFLGIEGNISLMEMWIDENTETMYINETAETMFYNFLDIPSTLYDVAITEQTNCVTITGNISGEVVTVTYDETDSAFTISSTNASHAAHVHYIVNRQCPNNASRPSWFEEFLNGNMISGTATVSATKPKPVLNERLLGR